MNDKTEQKNGVNGTANSSSRVVLGGSVSQQQGTLDCHPVTACNIQKKTRIVTWNVRPMNQHGKLECITREASRLKLDVLGLSEVRWKNSGKCTTDEHVMIYSGHKTEHKHGVGVLRSKQMAKVNDGVSCIVGQNTDSKDCQQTIQPRDCSGVCANKY